MTVLTHVKANLHCVKQMGILVDSDQAATAVSVLFTVVKAKKVSRARERYFNRQVYDSSTIESIHPSMSAQNYDDALAIREYVEFADELQIRWVRFPAG